MRNRVVALSLLLLTASTMTFADSTVPYIGASIGGNQDNLRLSDATSTNTNFWSSGVTGGVFAGISWRVNPKIYLAGEGFANEMSARSSTKTINLGNGTTTTAMMRMRYNFGVSVLPGIKISDIGLVYARLGVIRTGIELHQAMPPASATSSISENTATGGQIGIGIQGFIAESVALRGEYDYSAYHSFSAFGNSITPHDNQVSIGLLYQFC